MTKWQARFALAVVFAVLLIPMALIHVHIQNSALWAGHHTTVLAFITAIVVIVAVALAGFATIVLALLGIVELFKRAR